jgi:hypothetical protein
MHESMFVRPLRRPEGLDRVLADLDRYLDDLDETDGARALWWLAMSIHSRKLAQQDRFVPERKVAGSNRPDPDESLRAMTAGYVDAPWTANGSGRTGKGTAGATG